MTNVDFGGARPLGIANGDSGDPSEVSAAYLKAVEQGTEAS